MGHGDDYMILLIAFWQNYIDNYSIAIDLINFGGASYSTLELQS